MKTVQRLVFGAAIAIASPWISLQSASAATIVNVFSQSSVYEDGVGTQTDTPSQLMQSNILIPLSLSSNISIPVASASGQTTGVAGTLKAKTSASASGSNVVPDGDSQGSASAQVFVSDQVTVASSTLANGTPVSLLLSMLVEGNLPISGNDDPNYFGTAVASFSGGTTGQPFDLLFRSDMDANYTIINGQRQYNRLLTGVYSTSVGTVIPIGYQLFIQSTARSRLGQLLEAVTDFGNTGLFYIDSQTPGVTLVAESGHNYASPTSIPTPALLPGLIAFGASILRQRKKMCA